MTLLLISLIVWLAVFLVAALFFIRDQRVFIYEQWQVIEGQKYSIGLLISERDALKAESE